MLLGIIVTPGASVVKHKQQAVGQKNARTHARTHSHTHKHTHLLLNLAMYSLIACIYVGVCFE